MHRTVTRPGIPPQKSRSPECGVHRLSSAHTSWLRRPATLARKTHRCAASARRRLRSAAQRRDGGGHFEPERAVGRSADRPTAFDRQGGSVVRPVVFDRRLMSAARSSVSSLGLHRGNAVKAILTPTCTGRTTESPTRVRATPRQGRRRRGMAWLVAWGVGRESSGAELLLVPPVRPAPNDASHDDGTDGRLPLARRPRAAPVPWPRHGRRSDVAVA